MCLYHILDYILCTGASIVELQIIWLSFAKYVTKQEIKLLNFEHIVQVNDHEKPEMKDITRHQLWQGLVLRARSPEKFNPNLKCRSLEQQRNEFIRNIEVGNTIFCEKVILYPKEKIKTFTIEEINQLYAESNTSIEEPATGSLFVRFQYKREIENSQKLDIAEYLKTAYLQLDVEAISMIRMMTEKKYLPLTN